MNNLIPLAKDALILIGLLKKSILYTKNEISHLFEIGLEDYLITEIEKYIEINTFFHQENKINFYDVYYNLEVLTNDLNDKLKFEYPINNLKNNRFVTIIGSAGSGKSMLTKYIYLQTIQECRKIPILLELRLFNVKNLNLENYICNQLLGKGLKPNLDTLQRSLKDGVFLIILDGYDEIYSSNIQELINQIENFIDKYKENHFIITSRPEAGAERLARFKPYYVQGLKKFEIIGFVNKIITNIERRERMLSSIRNPDNSNYIDYLSNPLLLSMFLMTFQKFPEIPRRKSEFYHNIFDTLYSKHDGITKNSFVRERRSGLDKRNLEYILSVISYQFFIIGRYEFSESELKFILMKIRHNDSELSFDDEKVVYDLTTSLSILIRDGLNLTFPHRSLQEYFTGIFIHSFINNEEQREKMYSNLISGLLTTSLDSFQNFWEICKELDEIGFYKSFLLKYLRKIQKLFKDSDENINMLALFTLTGLKISTMERASVKYSKSANATSLKKTQEAQNSLLNYIIIINNSEFNKYHSFLNYLELDKQIMWFDNFINSKSFKNSLSNKLTIMSNNKSNIWDKYTITDGKELELKNSQISDCLIEVFKEQKLLNRLKHASKFIDQKILDINEKINMNIYIKDSLANSFLK